MTLTESVSARIREELRRQDVSFRELGRRMGVSLAYISRRLSDEPDVEFKVGEIDRVAQALGVPVTKFLPTRREASAAQTPTRQHSEPTSPGLGVATAGGSAEPGEVAPLGEAVGATSPTDRT